MSKPFSVFTDLNLCRLVNSVLRKNQPSIKLMERLGFHVEANLHPDYESIVGILNNPANVPVGAYTHEAKE